MMLVIITIVVALLLLDFMEVNSIVLVNTDQSLAQNFFTKFNEYSTNDECNAQVNQDLKAISFSSSFYAARRNELLSDDRWMYNMLECFKESSKHNELSSYCYGYDDEHNNMPYNDAMALGICVPNKCASDRVELLKGWSKILELENSTSLSYSSCINSFHNVPWYLDVAFQMQIIITIVLVTLVYIGTSLEQRYGDLHSSFLHPIQIPLSTQILMEFSIHRNLHKLTEFPKDPLSTIKCMFGLRVISMIWTMIGHCFAWIQAYVENVNEFKDDLSDGLFSLIITNFTLSVDTFFLLSATLTSYSYFQKQLKKAQVLRPNKKNLMEKIGDWLKFYRHRLVRLWPAYLYTLSLVTFLLSSLHWHPLWEPTDPAVQCRRHGWKNVLFINSLIGNECMGWTWYISTEFIFYLISPIFLIALNKSLWFGLALSLFTIAYSSISKALFIYENDYPPSPIPFKQPSMFKGTFMQHIDGYYIKPQYRIGPYIVGIILGYILAQIQKTKTKLLSDSQQLQWLLWSIAIVFSAVALFGFYPVMKGWNWRFYYMLYGGTHRTVWAIAIAVVIYMCHCDQGGILNSVLSARIFLPLSSLCYSVYLIHLAIVFGVFLWLPFPVIYTGKVSLLFLCIIQLILSYICALLITLLIELPILGVEKVLISWSNERAQHEAQKAYPLILNNRR